MRHQVPAGHVRRIDVRLTGDEADEVALLDLAQAPDRLHVLLAVELEPLRVGGPVQVDGELRHPQQRPVDVHQPVRTVTQGQPARQAEVPVEPGVEEGAAVDLDGDLAPAVRARVRTGLDPQIGGVGVGPHDPERGVRRGALRHVPGDDRPTAQDVLPARRGVPGRGLLDLPETGLLQPGRGRGDGVVRGGTGHQEGHQVVGVPAVEAEGRTHVLHCIDGGPGGFTADGRRRPSSSGRPRRHEDGPPPPAQGGRAVLTCLA